MLTSEQNRGGLGHLETLLTNVEIMTSLKRHEKMKVLIHQTSL
jgi:hypothetical protein